MADSADGPIFRGNKRRKTFRKRTKSDDDEESTSQTPAAAPLPSGASAEKEDDDGSSNSQPNAARLRRPKKHGIAFSSSDRSTSRLQNESEVTPTIAEPQSLSESSGRFARQTGKAIVADDKHMSTYIDSKMAEMRASARTPKPSAPFVHNLEAQRLDQPQPSPGSTDRLSTPLSPSNPPSSNQAAPPTTEIKKPTTSNPPSKRRHDRPPRQPSPSTQARASLIDEIMRESNHTPHYTPANPNPSTPKDTDLDPDAAAAAAFKADFLAQAEARNLSRRRPAVNASTTAAAATSGPKLGGSRSAREKMRAAEEAKAKK